MQQPQIEILYFDGCPNHVATAELVGDVAAELGVVPVVTMVDVPDQAAAERTAFLGSPTVRVNGRDVEPGSESRTEYRHACRIYHTDDGLRGIPEASWIRAALRPAPPR